MRVLLIGSGGREHALAHALATDPAVEQLIAAPGNPGIARLAQLHQVVTTDPRAVALLAQSVRADLVVIGPEAPLVAGVADSVRAAGIACFGPSAAAAMLEGSKAFAKQVMATAGVPTARHRVCTDEATAAQALDEFGPPYVVKDDALAAGKGVVVTIERAEALRHAQRCSRVVIEEFLDGPEISMFVVTDGTAALPLVPAQDFKRLHDFDGGPNTGGMGAYAPLPWATADLSETVMSTVVRPTLAAMADRGTPFSGLLYAGLALTAAGPRVVEFNARFGDPEGQVVLALLETPLAGLLYAAATATLAEHEPLRWRDAAAVLVVIAAPGYPDQAQLGGVITGADAPGILHAGTARREGDGALVSAGGRVLGCLGVAEDLENARRRAYRLVDGVRLTGAQHRRDIALAAVQGRVSVPQG